MKYFATLLLCLLSMLPSEAQDKYFTDVSLATDNRLYKLSENAVQYREKQALYFEYTRERAVCEIRFYVRPDAGVVGLSFAPSASYDVLDSLCWVDNCYRGRLRLLDLQSTQQLSLLVNAAVQADEWTRSLDTWELPLFPYVQTWVKLFQGSDDLYVGEEKVIELESNNASNVKTSAAWLGSNGVDYRVVQRDSRLFLHLMPKEAGTRSIVAEMEAAAPFLDTVAHRLGNRIALMIPNLVVRSNRIAFLNINRKEVTYDSESQSKGVVINIDNHRNLQINRTYRIEAQEKPGGTLVGELYTMESLANDKVLCKLTVFNLHRITDGYLYIKDRDRELPVFITNIDITPKMQITGVQVLREGDDWQRSATVHPGERIDVVVEGNSLHKSRFTWQDVYDLTVDTVNQTENRRYFKLRIPMNINKRNVDLLNNGQPTGTSLTVEEYRRPHPFDFITLNYGDFKSVKLNKANNVILARSVMNKFILSFNRSVIDSSRLVLYGKQYLDVELRVLGSKGEIIELQSLKNILVSPDETSPRGAFYTDRNSLKEDLNINNFLSNKTEALDRNFGKIQLTVKQSADKYTDPVFEKHIEVVYQPKVIFDIDLSFPGGMLIQNLGESQTERDAKSLYNEAKAEYDVNAKNYADALEQWKTNPGYDPANIPPEPTAPVAPKKAAFTDNLGGISIALIGQLRFTDDRRAGKLKPYRVGAGFLFINTLNFNDNARRDLAVVVLGSIYPLSSRRMWNVPIHVGFGYKVQDKIPFLMISPGISISF
ncbi:MAG: hypothetical protein LBT48_01630 [Prevotellaceae bacterium]|jgi:hypothetical protein|nr:hypothetical protein [Prevotellaceae bacterium]